MDKKTYGIGVMALTAAVLLVGNILVNRTPALAATAVRDRDYQVVTARSQTGGESLYIVDNKTGQMAVFAWDATSRTVKAQAVRPVTDAFLSK